MRLDLEPGKYIAAISGGVDSMVLLDLLSNLPGIEIVVAHFNHGMREDSRRDEQLVRAAAEKYGLSIEAGYGKLGAAASEETARRARYYFLETSRRKHAADKIITAHHQDDWIETAFINLLRGSGRLGLSSIASNPEVLRPLLGTPKSDILDYARKNKLLWREDPTNSDEKYLRNHLRRQILPKISRQQRRDLVLRLRKMEKLNREISRLLEDMTPDDISRYEFAQLPVKLGNELLVEWLRRNNIGDYDARTIQRLNMTIRTARPRTTHPIRSTARLQIDESKARLIRT
jgi:tRNA(Ile)-lysidine synthase